MWRAFDIRCPHPLSPGGLHERLGQRMGELAILCSLWSMVGCGTTPRVLVPETVAAHHESLTVILDANPLAEGENIKALALGHTPSLSYHLVQIRDREHPHVHVSHDLVVSLLRGTGTFFIRGAAVEMRAGDVAVVPRGTPHYFVNRKSTPAAAFATFAPPYDGTDQVPAEDRP